MYGRNKSGRERGTSGRSPRSTKKNGSSSDGVTGDADESGHGLPLPVVPTRSATVPSFGTPTFKRRARGGRKARVVPIRPPTVSNNRTLGLTPGSSGLPGTYQYTTTLVRRAIRKRHDSGSVEPSGSTVSQEEKNDNDSTASSSFEGYGDVSLGMKLIVAGGKVIVQSLNALDDGRASPAQLTGLIQRGDVLLAIEDVVLAQLPIDQLMSSLQPLSTPETRDGQYRKTLTLRLEAGAGHDLLNSHERSMMVPPRMMDTPTAAVNDMFSLFPMVDQLSGAPLFEAVMTEEPNSIDHVISLEQEIPDDEEDGEDEMDQEEDTETVLNVSGATEESSSRDIPTPEEVIAALVARDFSQDQKRFASLYFNWSDGLFPEHLRAVLEVDETTNTREMPILTKTQRIELGTKVMTLTERLTDGMEDMDKGKDLRSFKIWSSNFSMRSGATLRRRAVMDAASLRSHRHREPVRRDLPRESDNDSTGTGEVDSVGSLDPDALLLGLAAHDDIWRKNVLEALNEAIRKMESGEDGVGDDWQGAKQDEDDDINKALSNQLENFLFGENLNKIVKKKNRSFALPPQDVTTVLFDLSTHITTTAPDEVTLFGGTTNSFSIQSSFGTQAKAKRQLRADIMQAHYFLLDEALPLWLASFRPMGLDHRRLFWPTLTHAGSQAGPATHASDNDSLTVDSHDAIPKASQRPLKNLQETIEDLELDVETRSETYFFSQKILSKYSNCKSDDELHSVDMEVEKFLKKFGAYLQIHSCLVSSAKVEADKAIDHLLDLARFDPSHREARKELAKASAMTFYESTKLSALLEFLGNIRNDSTAHRDAIKNLCVAAYPDVQPWQVRKACLGPAPENGAGMTGSAEEDLYYSYLSQLLDPVEGHESARRNSSLVMEWCRWSTDGSYNRNRVKNFYQVASRTSSTHLSFRRDLLALFDMSMSIKDYDLALGLASEVIEDRKLCNRSKDVTHVLLGLRKIATEALRSAWKSINDNNSLKRVLRAFHEMSTSDYLACRESIDVPRELVSLLKIWEKQVSTADTATLPDLIIMIDFIINESAPSDVLSALAMWSSTKKLGIALYPRLQALLRRGVQTAPRSEVSTALLQLRHIRSSYKTHNEPLATYHGPSPTSDASINGGELSIWKQMSLGALVIDK